VQQATASLQLYYTVESNLSVSSFSSKMYSFIYLQRYYKIPSYVRRFERKQPTANYFHEKKYLFTRRKIFFFMKRNSFLRENNLEAVVILNFFCNFVHIKKTLKDSQKMEKENHIDRALAFMENLEKLGAQLQKADEQQKLMLQQMLTKSQNKETNTDEYRELEQRSKDLQAMINKWRPIYEERLKMVKEAQKAAKK